MRCIASVLCACTLAVLVESVPPVGVCRVQVPGDGPKVLYILQSNERRCNDIYMGARDSEARRANTTEQLRLVFKRACDAGSDHAECLARVRVDAETCLVGVEKAKFILYLGYKETLYQARCQDSGVRSSTIYEGQRERLSDLFPRMDDIVLSCVHSARRTVALPSVNLDNTNRQMFITYIIVRASKECLEKHRGGDQDTLVDAQAAHWSDLLNTMKCLDPKDKKEVLCKTMVEAFDN